MRAIPIPTTTPVQPKWEESICEIMDGCEGCSVALSTYNVSFKGKSQDCHVDTTPSSTSPLNARIHLCDYGSFSTWRALCLETSVGRMFDLGWRAGQTERFLWGWSADAAVKHTRFSSRGLELSSQNSWRTQPPVTAAAGDPTSTSSLFMCHTYIHPDRHTYTRKNK